MPFLAVTMCIPRGALREKILLVQNSIIIVHLDLFRLCMWFHVELDMNDYSYLFPSKCLQSAIDGYTASLNDCLDGVI